MPLFGSGFISIGRPVKSFFPFEWADEKPAAPAATAAAAQSAEGEKPAVEDNRTAVDIILPMVKGYEKFRPDAELDTIPKTPVWTVGFGTVNRVDGTKVKQGDKMTKEEALAETRARLQRDFDRLSNTYPGFRKLEPRHQAAYLDIEYNSGSINETGSPKVHAELMKENPDLNFLRGEIPSYRRSGGVVVDGLVNRRVDTLKVWDSEPGWEWTRKWNDPEPKK